MDQNKTQLSAVDRFIVGLDRAVRTLSPGSISPTHPSPAKKVADRSTGDEKQRRHISGLMRINHTGEVCAQALYQGQALTARDQKTRLSMQESADEEEDHLAWCEERLKELNSRISYLNPVFYGLSFSIGALAGVVGDKWSLGFIAATEEQVCHHLRSHLEQVPEQDQKTRAILEQMLIDEERHGEKALHAGGATFSPQTKSIMTTVSKVMTKLTYRI